MQCFVDHAPPVAPPGVRRCTSFLGSIHATAVCRASHLLVSRFAFRGEVQERLVLYCRTTSASTAPRPPRRTCCPGEVQCFVHHAPPVAPATWCAVCSFSPCNLDLKTLKSSTVNPGWQATYAFRTATFSFRVSSFGFWVAGFGARFNAVWTVLAVGFRVPGLGVTL